MRQLLMPLADGVEEIEAVTVVDTFVRAGWHVRTAGIAGTAITASRGVRLVADCEWADIASEGGAGFDVLVIPGGSQGVSNLLRCRPALDMARDFCSSGRIVGAICAGPLVLHEAGLLAGRKVTSYPSVAARLTGAEWIDAAVVVDGNIVTSQGPGTSFDFALTILKLAGDGETAGRVAADLLLNRRSSH